MHTPENTTLGFIGTGVMGQSMARHLLRKGYPLHVYTRTRSKAQELLEAGAHWSNSPAELAEQCNVVITMVGYPQDVEEIYLGEGGLITRAKAGTCLIDMTTSCPLLAQRIHRKAQNRSIQTLDAPVSGGDIGAHEARLSIMAGGERKAFEACGTLFASMGKDIVYQGQAGSGQHTKMCNQIAIASTMVGMCEALIYAQASGLNPETVLQSIAKGAAGSFSLSNLAPRIIDRNFAPGFYVKHFIKDMGIALASAQKMQLRTPGLSLALSLYQELAELGKEDLGTHALYQIFEHKASEGN